MIWSSRNEPFGLVIRVSEPSNPSQTVLVSMSNFSIDGAKSLPPTVRRPNYQQRKMKQQGFVNALLSWKRRTIYYSKGGQRQKSDGLLRQTSEVTTTQRYQLMEEETHYAKAKSASILGVSTSGYYTWIQKRDNRIPRKDQLRADVLRVFEEGDGAYGAERICGILRTEGEKASFPVVRAIMAEEKIQAKHCVRRQRSLTGSSAARDDRYENHVKGLDIARRFQMLSSDITYIRTAQGFEYLCQIIDVHTKEIVGSAQASHMKSDLVLEAIERAVGRYNLGPGIIFHSDHGSQYTSKPVTKAIARLGWIASYSRVGNPGDNAWSESFFALLKKEMVHGANFQTREEARQRIFEYIHGFYNTRRKQKLLGYRSPCEFAARLQVQSLRNAA